MSTPNSVMPRSRTLTDAQLSAYRSLLEEQWRYQLGDIAELSQDAIIVGEVEDDDGARTCEQLLNRRLVAAARQQLQETEDALARLDDGSFGTCGSCGEPITPERLEILPAARLCVACQARRTAR